MSFEIEQREPIYQGRAFRVERLGIRLPNGKKRLFDLVDHNPSITVIPVTEDGQVLFVRQHRVVISETMLELPAGVLEDGEDPLEGARRELREETGMDAREMIKLGAVYLVPGYCNEFMHFYLARGLFPAPLAQDEDEFIDLERFSLAETYRMARSGELNDSKTLAALLLAERELSI